MTAKWLDSSMLASAVLAEAERRVARVVQRTMRPIGVTTLRVVTGDAASIETTAPATATATWAAGFAAAQRHATRLAKTLGIDWTERELYEPRQNEIVAAIHSLNYDSQCTGVVLFRPSLARVSSDDLRAIHEAVAPEKDVEGMSPTSIGRLVYGSPVLWPCAARAAVDLCAAAVGGDLVGLECLVVGTSDVVAKPVTSILHARGATVTTCPADAPKLAVRARSADAVFVAQGPARQDSLVTGDMLKPGCCVIDIGHDGPAGRGNADIASCMRVAGSVATVARGIAKLRTAYLLLNVAAAAEIQAGLRPPERDVSQPPNEV